MIKKIFKALLDMWNIYAGILLSTIVAWILDWAIDEMDVVTSFLVMSLTFVAALTFFKTTILKKKGNVIDKAISKKGSIEAITTATNPEAAGEEVGNTILTVGHTIERLGKSMKNFFKRLWGNKFTILNIVINLIAVAAVDYLTFSEYLLRFDFFVENELAFKIGIPVLSVLYLILDIFTTVTKYGWESISELQAKSEEKAKIKAQALSKEQKIVLKSQIKAIKSGIESAESQIKTFNAIIKNFEVIQSLGISTTADKVDEYNNAIAQTQILESSKEQFEAQLDKFEEMLK